MKKRYRIVTKFQFLLFAFYPKTALIICIVCIIGLSVASGFWLQSTTEGTLIYNILFSLFTGAIASFFVSFMIELAGNYRRNKLAWYELQEYYEAMLDYQSETMLLMGMTIGQRASRNAMNNVGKSTEASDDMPEDRIQTVWKLLPKFIPINKKAFLSDNEIQEMDNIIHKYQEIYGCVKWIISHSYIYDMENHPDVNFLKERFPRNVLDDMSKESKELLAKDISEETIDKLTEAVLKNKFLREQVFHGYDISMETLKKFEQNIAEKDIDLDENQEHCDESIDDFSENGDIEEEAEISEDEFRVQFEKMNQVCRKKDLSFFSIVISNYCNSIADSMDKLEQMMLNKPIVGLFLRTSRKCAEMPDNELSKELLYKMVYDSDRR